MALIKQEAVDYQIKRFMRPDWRRFVQRGSELERFYKCVERKYSPAQPRDDHGRWTKEEGENALGSPAPSAPKEAISRQVASECELMHRQDLFICKLTQSPACYTQAYLRYSNCLVGRPIPPLNF